MTKILLQNDRIIFDGHADSMQECETITLLCDSLANNLNFKTIRYERGYAEFEKVGKAEKLMFVPAPAEITMVFDSHITAVNSRSPMTVSWTTSGETKTTVSNDGTTYTFDVTLSSGYIIDTVTLSESDEQLGKLTEKTDTTFSILAGSGGIFQTITITSKVATSQKSYDLSTSSKWSTLSDGEYTVQIVAKGAGYRDSAKSTSVTVTKSSSTGETWVLNEYPTISETITYNVNFTTNNESKTSFELRNVRDSKELYYDGELVYSNGNWEDPDYRTITFETAPTGDLLTWLQANGTKQGGATLINFTINGTSYQAEQGMTWQQWVNSSYNTGGYIVYGGEITNSPPGGSRVTTDSAHDYSVRPTDIITATAYYQGQAN